MCLGIGSNSVYNKYYESLLNINLVFYSKYYELLLNINLSSYTNKKIHTLILYRVASNSMSITI